MIFSGVEGGVRVGEQRGHWVGVTPAGFAILTFGYAVSLRWIEAGVVVFCLPLRLPVVNSRRHMSSVRRAGVRGKLPILIHIHEYSRQSKVVCRVGIRKFHAYSEQISTCGLRVTDLATKAKCC